MRDKKKLDGYSFGYENPWLRRFKERVLTYHTIYRHGLRSAQGGQ